MQGKSCFFIGHRDSPSELLPSLTYVIEDHILKYGIQDFYIGHYGNFDAMALRALTKLKKRYPHIRRIMVTPYHPAQQLIEKPKDFDEIFFPFEESVIPRYAIAKANRKMLDSCGYVIAYARYSGKSRDFLEYAQKRQSKKLLHVSALEPLVDLPNPEKQHISELGFLAEIFAYVYLTTNPQENDHTAQLLSETGKASEIALLSLYRQIFRSDFDWALEQAENRIDEFIQDWKFELQQNGKDENEIAMHLESTMKIKMEFNVLKTLII